MRFVIGNTYYAISWWTGKLEINFQQFIMATLINTFFMALYDGSSTWKRRKTYISQIVEILTKYSFIFKYQMLHCQNLCARPPATKQAPHRYFWCFKSDVHFSSYTERCIREDLSETNILFSQNSQWQQCPVSESSNRIRKTGLRPPATQRPSRRLCIFEFWYIKGQPAGYFCQYTEFW